MQQSAKLINDNDYLQLKTQELQFPFSYYTAFAPNKLERNPFHTACTKFSGGCKQFNVNGSNVDKYNQRIVPGAAGGTRNFRSASTQIMGGPFKARGDGALMNPDALSQAWMPSGGFAPTFAKPLSEETYDTFACIEAKNASEDEFDLRGGIPTPQGPKKLYSC